MSTKETSLLDELQAALHTDRGFMHDPIHVRGSGRSVAMKLRHANCFKLSDDFTRHATRLSLGSASEVHQLWQSARPPYPLTWIEFSEAVRGHEQQKCLPILQPDYMIWKTGYLIEQDQHDPARYYVSVCFSSYDPGSLFHMQGSNLDTNDPIMIPDDRSRKKIGICDTGFAIDTEKPIALNRIEWNAPRYRQGFRFGDLSPKAQQCMFGELKPKELMDAVNHYIAIYNRDYVDAAMLLSRSWSVRIMRDSLLASNREMNANTEQRREASALNSILMRTQAMVSEFAGIAAFPRDRKYGRPSDETFATMLLANEGDARFLVTILGLMQSTFFEQTVTRPAGHRRYVGHGTTLPFLAQHELTIVAPKDHVITLSDVNKEASGRHHRRHEVHGHWAYKHKGFRQDCQHEWRSNNQGTQQVCVSCNSKRWWKKPHERGDASLGYATKVYRVTTPEV